MSVVESPAAPVLSNPADRKKLRGMLDEIQLILRSIEDKKIEKKIILDEIKRQFDLSPKFANKLAKTMFNDDFEAVAAEAEDFETLYETIVKMNPAPVLKVSEEDEE